MSLEAHIDSAPIGERLALLGQYEVDYRRRHGRPLPVDYVNRQVLEAFRTYRELVSASGVDPVQLMLHIEDALHRRRDPLYFGAPLRWYAKTIEEWIRLTQTPSFDLLPSSTRTLILRHLLRTDLYPFHPHPATRKTTLRQTR